MSAGFQHAAHLAETFVKVLEVPYSEGSRHGVEGVIGKGEVQTVFFLERYDVVIMDPPRSGASKQSKELSKSTVKRIVYVSCNPTTFVRDKKILEHGGYKMTVAIPIDQFVGSPHWEIFSVFEK